MRRRMHRAVVVAFVLGAVAGVGVRGLWLGRGAGWRAGNRRAGRRGASDRDEGSPVGLVAGEVCAGAGHDGHGAFRRGCGTQDAFGWA
ncbi:MAG: hypothetical protein AB1700_08200 [Bacillota bacterium]